MGNSQVLRISREFSLKEEQVSAVVVLLDDSATVPFIARYRKEATGCLDEVAISKIRDRVTQLRRLDERREAIIKSLAGRKLLTEDLKGKIVAAETLADLEDIYLPYRLKRRTRASMAKEKGLESLARQIFAQQNIDLVGEARAFVNSEKGVHSWEEAVSGARDIIAEWISEDADARSSLRELFESQGILTSQLAAKKEEASASKYRDYFDWSEPAKRAPSHRLLAMMRGRKEGYLSLHLLPPEDSALKLLDRHFLRGGGPASQQVKLAIRDSYRRLLAPSLENETLSAAKARADQKAIEVFAQNLRQLILEPPLGQKNVLAVDPGFRTGCKLAVLDGTGKLVYDDVIYPHEPSRRIEAEEKVIEICERFGIEVIAVGNGTAGRETEAFLNKLKLAWKIPVILVNEAGASVYSVSEEAREEFPDQDATVRGAVSIGRRLIDPLAELVKIDPRAIGVGQYQHDVEQSELKRKLDDVVMSCVNLVGVDLNTASKQLLTYISGLGPKLAESIIKYREEHGPFQSREDLKKVARLGPKAFEQAAGFLRIGNGESPLDKTSIHPESYEIVEMMAQDLGVSVEALMRNEALLKKIELERYVTEKIGLATLKDIVEELFRPGRDPREQREPFCFAEGVETIEDLRPGMKLPGIVTNVTSFGAFVDIGVHQDGLIHISQLSESFVRNPSDVVRVQQSIKVTVLDVDLERKRISLSMKSIGEK